MKIIELYESDNPLAGLRDAELLELIKRDCQPFIKSNVDGLMFRGMRNKGVGAFKQSVRADRKPKNMAPEIHTKIDDWFQTKFGIKARSETVFVTGDFADARSYGKVYAILPIGEFDFVWSPNVGDLFLMFHNEKEADVPDRLEELKYQTTDLKAAIDSYYEIMVRCKQYYAVPMYSQDEANVWMNQLESK